MNRMNFERIALVSLGYFLIFFMSGCEVKDLNGVVSQPSNPAPQDTPAPQPTPTPTGTPVGFQDPSFTLENIDYWYAATVAYGNEWAFTQYVDGSAQPPLYYHVWSKWEVGYAGTLYNPANFDTPNSFPILFYLICIADDTERAKANAGLQYNAAGLQVMPADPTVAALNANYNITSVVTSTSPVTCQFTITAK